MKLILLLIFWPLKTPWPLKKASKILPENLAALTKNCNPFFLAATNNFNTLL